MHQLALIVSLVVALGDTSGVASSHAPGETNPVRIDYLGQPRPGEVAELFAPAVVSTGLDELNSVFSQDGSEFYFSVKRPNQDRHIMMVMERTERGWSEPRVLPFSGAHGDADPAFSPDGDRLFFISKRPMEGTADTDTWSIWYVDRVVGGWSDPAPLGAPVNTASHETHPSLTNDGTIYFSSNREGGQGGFDVYRARSAGGTYSSAENLGPPVNTEHGEGDLCVAPDESFLILSSGRPGGLGSNDLYVSFQEDGRWTEPVNLGEGVNSDAIDYSPALSPGGEFLFFSSYRVRRTAGDDRPRTIADVQAIYSSPQNGLGDIYWVDARVIESVR